MNNNENSLINNPSVPLLLLSTNKTPTLKATKNRSLSCLSALSSQNKWGQTTVFRMKLFDSNMQSRGQITWN